MLIGRAERKVDAAGRLLVPPRFRPGLEIESASVVYVSLWTTEDPVRTHIRLYPKSIFQGLYDEQRTPGFDVDGALLRITSSTETADVDANLRIRIEADALEAIGVKPKGQVRMIGGGNHVQLWAPDRWEKMSRQLPPLPGGGP